MLTLILTAPSSLTDISCAGVGAVLSQDGGHGEQVVAYNSRVLTRPERDYCVTRRENFEKYLKVILLNQEIQFPTVIVEFLTLRKV